MSAVQVIVHNDGHVELLDFAFSVEEAAEPFSRWVAANDLATDGPRGAELAAVDLQRASDDLREVCAPRFADLDDFEAFLIRGMSALRQARKEAS